MARSVSTASSAVTAALSKPAEFELFLGKLGARDKANIDRHVAACEAESTANHYHLWRRLVQVLFTLAGHAVQTAGQQAIQFFVADGKYRMQLFALEDLRDGKVIVYLPDVLQQALDSGLLTAKKNGDSYSYAIKRSGGEGLEIESLDGATPNPSPWFKHMLGWNRKALRIILPASASESQLSAVERLCGFAAQPYMN